MNAEEFAELVSTPILFQVAVKQARQKVEITSKDSPYIEEFKAELAATLTRWDAEAPVREAREALRKLGWEKSQFDPKVWYNRKTKIKKSLIEVVRSENLAR